MKVNVERNHLYYSDNSLEICDCENCQNYYRNISKEFSAIEDYLKSLGIDILKPFELIPIDFEEKREIEYIGCQYVVFGECEDNFEKIISGIKFTKNIDNHPSTNLEEQHFVLEFGPITLKWI